LTQLLKVINFKAAYIDMDKREIVELIIIGIGIIFVIFEIILNLNEVEDDTTNIILYEATKKRLLFIPFAVGAIAGHLFLGTTRKVFPDHRIIPALENEVVVILGLVTVSLLLFLLTFVTKHRGRLFLTSLLITGLFYGHFFWSMND
jgi:hypothetical protein